MKITVLPCNEINVSHMSIKTSKVLIEAIVSVLIKEYNFVRAGYYSFERRLTEMKV